MKAINQDFQREGKCINEETLVQYIHGELDAKQQHEVEMHLLHCELCSDALEGLRIIKNRDKTTEIVAALKHQMNEHLLNNNVRKPVFMQWWQVAAIFIILILGAGSYFEIKHYAENPPENSVALRSTDKTNTPPPPIIRELQEVKSPVATTVEKPSSNARKIRQSVNEETIEKESSDKPAPSTPAITTDEDLLKAKKDYEYYPAAKAEVKLDKTSNEKLKDIDNIKSPTAVNESINERQFNEGMHLYNENNYSMALNSFNKAGPNPKANFYAGKCQYNLNNYHEAINEIDKAITDSTSQFYEEALWLKANALLGLKKKEKAKPILKKVIQLDGVFKNQANDLLKNL